MRPSDYPELYRLLRQKLDDEIEPTGAISVAERDATSLAPIAAIRQVGAMLRRLGLLQEREEANPASVEALLRKISHTVGVTEQAAALTFLQYATGPGGNTEQAICGDSPRCRECPPALQCRHRSPRPTIKSLPEDERPRERLLRGGEDQLSDSELLAIIIRDGTQEASALDLARKLISTYKTFRAMKAASLADLCALKGIGPAKAAQIKAALAIGRRSSEEKLTPGKSFRSSREVFEYFSERLRDEKKEIFWSVLLDQKNKVIKLDPISVGSLSESLVHPREVFRSAIRESAASIIFVHNHPSGDPQPSHQDIEVTKKLVQTSHIVGINVLDHIIIGSDDFVSLKTEGLM